ncbi:helix-turn-helix domain-containing protein [Paenibacillus thalictri]|uniref:AraC family transcriptional regulator n=1 Tax=Paenibacillus thalictri TaxID=2527873 RepID=A0A4Q9DID5_9BACL|nr:AraC family transcriptional regulator [Paenibacillus thalictri]TBL72375.1 AraC family transcriptional regulator [Paenibacillus thalictri]
MYAPPYEFNQYVYAGPQPGFIKPEETYKQYVILGVEAGSFDYAVGRHTGKASFGDLVFVPPGTNFKRRSHGEITFHLLTFSSLFEPNPVFETLPVGKVTVGDVSRLSSTYTYLRKLWQQFGSESHKTNLAHHMLIDLLHLSELERIYTLKRKKKTDPQMQQAAGYIHRNLFDEVNMNQIAQKLGIRPSELTRRFRMEYDASPVEYATRLRLEEVKRLLLETNYTLEAIASLCGYENGSYLSRVFRSKIGINASEFRKNNQI